jgi:hypothetical protein
MMTARLQLGETVCREIWGGGYHGHDLIGLGPERLAFLYSVQNEFNNLAARLAMVKELLYQNILFAINLLLITIAGVCHGV